MEDSVPKGKRGESIQGSEKCQEIPRAVNIPKSQNLSLIKVTLIYTFLISMKKKLTMCHQQPIKNVKMQYPNNANIDSKRPDGMTNSCDNP